MLPGAIIPAVMAEGALGAVVVRLVRLLLLRRLMVALVGHNPLLLLGNLF